MEPRTDEVDSDDQVGKGQPICAVGEERILGIRCAESLMNTFKPEEELARRKMRLRETNQESGFRFEREGSDAT